MDTETVRGCHTPHGLSGWSFCSQSISCPLAAPQPSPPPSPPLLSPPSGHVQGLCVPQGARARVWVNVWTFMWQRCCFLTSCPTEPATTAGPALSCQTKEAGDTRLLPCGPSSRHMAVGYGVLTSGRLSSVRPLPGASPGHTADPVPEQPCPSGSPGLSSSCRGGSPRVTPHVSDPSAPWPRRWPGRGGFGEKGWRGQVALHAWDVSSAFNARPHSRSPRKRRCWPAGCSGDGGILEAEGAVGERRGGRWTHRPSWLSRRGQTTGRTPGLWGPFCSGRKRHCGLAPLGRQAGPLPCARGTSGLWPEEADRPGFGGGDCSGCRHSEPTSRTHNHC